jgi:hypothetical protein
MKGWL